MKDILNAKLRISTTTANAAMSIFRYFGYTLSKTTKPKSKEGLETKIAIIHQSEDVNRGILLTLVIIQREPPPLIPP